MTSKFVAFFQLIDACGQEGCPVCACVREEGLRYLGALMYEQVNDPETRARLQASWGFCNWHGSLLPDIPHSGLGVAIICEDLLGAALRRLRRLLTRLERGTLNGGGLFRFLGRVPRLAMLDAWRRRAACVVCQSSRASEEVYLRTILEFTGDPQFDRGFDRSRGICLPHLLRLTELGRGHPRLEPVLKKMETKWGRLRDSLKQFIDKHDYRATEKFSEEEALSWRQALEMLAGAPGLFGNELHGERPAVFAPSPAPVVPADRAATAAADPETLQFEKEKLQLRLKELTDQFSEVSGRAAALHYRLWQVLEDRKVLEMNLSGEQASSQLLERALEELRKEVDRLKGQAGGQREERAR